MEIRDIIIVLVNKLNKMSTTRLGKLKAEDISSDLQTVIKTLVNKICTSDEFINSIAKTITSTISAELETKINKLEAENRELNEQMQHQAECLKNLTSKYDNLDQQLRSKTVRIYGIKEQKNENIYQVIAEFIRKNLDVKINGKIENCYRSGKINEKKMRPIVVHFAYLEDKKLVYENKKKLKGKGMVIREDLTQENVKILKLTVEKINKNGMAWTSDGRIFVKLNEGNAIFRIKSIEDVNLLQI